MPLSQIRSQIAPFYTTGLSINDVVTYIITVDQGVRPPCLLSSRKGVYRMYTWETPLEVQSKIKIGDITSLFELIKLGWKKLCDIMMSS